MVVVVVVVVGFVLDGVGMVVFDIVLVDAGLIVASGSNGDVDSD
jgi:ABC-type proline/glycine betaine transport system substrate-binding protein